MLISNDENDQPIKGVTILLTPSEMGQLAAYAKRLSESPSGEHSHLSSEDYQQEVTLCVYELGQTSMLAENLRKLLGEA